MAALAPIVAFFLAFTLPSSLLALLALRDFLLRRAAPAPDLRRASAFLVLAGALPLAMVVLTGALLGGAPVARDRWVVFAGYGLSCAALGIAGAWLFRRAVEDPRRRLRKAAETLPLVLVMLNLVLVTTAARQIPPP